VKSLEDECEISRLLELEAVKLQEVEDAEIEEDKSDELVHWMERQWMAAKRNVMVTPRVMSKWGSWTWWNRNRGGWSYAEQRTVEEQVIEGDDGWLQEGTEEHGLEEWMQKRNRCWMGCQEKCDRDTQSDDGWMEMKRNLQLAKGHGLLSPATVTLG
jgi:hypothetical protein